MAFRRESSAILSSTHPLAALTRHHTRALKFVFRRESSPHSHLRDRISRFLQFFGVFLKNTLIPCTYRASLFLLFLPEKVALQGLPGPFFATCTFFALFLPFRAFSCTFLFFSYCHGSPLPRGFVVLRRTIIASPNESLAEPCLRMRGTSAQMVVVNRNHPFSLFSSVCP